MQFSYTLIRLESINTSPYGRFKEKKFQVHIDLMTKLEIKRELIGSNYSGIIW